MTTKKVPLLVCTIALSCVAFGSAALGNDWPSWRGPEQNGLSREKAVVTSWSESGENLLWKVPVGGRSTPILMDGRLFMIAPAGEGDCLRERVVCLDANSGETIWEHAFNVFHTDIVQARLGWTAVVGDPETGNVYAHGTGGELFCFSRDGQIRWKHSLTEEFGRSSGYGGRLHTPIIDEDKVIISQVYILTGWGMGKKKAGHRYLAFDKRTGDTIWTSIPGGRPLDTTYSVPAVAVIDGKRMLIAGNADGCAYGMLARTGEKLWKFKLSKRGINPSIVVDGKYAYVTHSEENIDGTVMGRVVCIDASLRGDITESGEVWRYDGLTAGYSSPALANGRLYVVSNSARMHCLDAKTGEEHWRHKLGRVMKGSPTVTADGIIYAGSVNGRLQIIKDAGDHAEVLDKKQFKREDRMVVEINGSPIVANGRIYFMTGYDTYCLGSAEAKSDPAAIPPMPAEAAANAANAAKASWLQVLPAETTLAPGERLQLEARLFDDAGHFLRTETATWTADGVKGTFDAKQTFTSATGNEFQAGFLKARVGDLESAARVRVSPRLPIIESFDGMKVGGAPPGWIGLDIKAGLVEKDGTVALKKMALKPSAKYMRMRSFSGPSQPTGYTVEVDLLGETKPSDSTVLPDMGLINARYKLILLGTDQKLRLVSYSPIPRVQVDVPFPWKANTWYHAKLRVDIHGDKGVVVGKVWEKGAQEPEGWTATLVDPCPNREGSPGLYGYSKGATDDAPGAPAYFDNYQVRLND